jgi:hypothetical protein
VLRQQSNHGSLTTISPLISGLVILIVFLLLGLALFGCAQIHKPANVPSSSAVRGDIQTAKAHIEQASAAVKAAGGNAAALDSLSDRMERKNIIIDRWLETHGQ